MQLLYSRLITHPDGSSFQIACGATMYHARIILYPCTTYGHMYVVSPITPSASPISPDGPGQSANASLTFQPPGGSNNSNYCCCCTVLINPYAHAHSISTFAAISTELQPLSKQQRAAGAQFRLSTASSTGSSNKRASEQTR
jgi:hypothetical protein